MNRNLDIAGAWFVGKNLYHMHDQAFMGKEVRLFPSRRKARHLGHGSDIFSIICVSAVVSPFPAGFGEDEDMASVLQGSAFFSSAFLKLL